MPTFLDLELGEVAFFLEPGADVTCTFTSTRQDDLIFADGFESGDTSLWSTTVGPGTSGTTYHGGGGTRGSALRVSGLADGPIAIAEAVASVEGSFEAIFAWDAERQQFLVYRPGVLDALNTLTELVPGQAIFIVSDDPEGIVWQQGSAIREPREVALVAGFNLVGWTGPDGFSLSALQELLGDALVSVFMLEPTTGNFASFREAAPDFLNDLQSLRYSRAFWVNVDRDVTLSMPAR